MKKIIHLLENFYVLVRSCGTLIGAALCLFRTEPIFSCKPIFLEEESSLTNWLFGRDK